MPHVRSTTKAKKTQFGFPRLSDFRSPRMLAPGHGVNIDGMIFEYCQVACLREIFELNVCSECSN